MGNIFSIIFYQPIFNLLIWLYNVLGQNVALSILGLTIIIKLILYPFSRQSIKAQKALQDIQPKINELKEKYKDDNQAMTREMMALYKQEKVNPFSSCLPMLVQLPFLYAVFRVFRDGLNSEGFNLLYPFVSNPGHIDPFILGYDLSHPLWVIGLLAGLAQFWATKMLMKTKQNALVAQGKPDATAMMNKQMLYFMPGLTVIFGLSLPGGLMLYWLANTLLQILQQYIMFGKKASNNSNDNNK